MISEFKLQAECFKWHWNNFPDQRGRLFTVNNNAPNAYAGSVMKAMGVVAGVSDMIWLSPTGAVMLEFKAEKGKQSLSQKWWEGVVQDAGYRYEVIRSVEDFQKVISAQQAKIHLADFFNKNKDCGVIGFRVFWGKQLPNNIVSDEIPYSVKSFVGCGHAWRMKAWNEIPNYPEWFVFYGEEDFASYHLFKNKWKIIYNPVLFVQHRVDLKARRNEADILKRTRMSFRSGLYLFFLFLPINVAAYSFLSSIWVYVKNKIFKGNKIATIAFFQVIFDLLINTPRLIRFRDTLTKEEYSIFKQLPDSQIFWKPKNKE